MSRPGSGGHDQTVAVKVLHFPMPPRVAHAGTNKNGHWKKIWGTVKVNYISDLIT